MEHLEHVASRSPAAGRHRLELPWVRRRARARVRAQDLPVYGGLDSVQRESPGPPRAEHLPGTGRTERAVSPSPGQGITDLVNRGGWREVAVLVAVEPARDTALAGRCLPERVPTLDQQRR